MPPTRGEMKAVLTRALRDEGQVFTSEVLNDFIEEGLSDLSLFRPAETHFTVPFQPGLSATSGLDPADYAELTYLWQVEAYAEQSDMMPMVIPYVSSGESPYRNGWHFYTNEIGLSSWWYVYLRNLVDLSPTGNVFIHLFGYRDRRFPAADDELLDLIDNIDHLCLLRHCKMLGFQLLEADRGLYQQWLAATNNTDVSPTQLQGMRGQAEQSYERLRKQSARPRRVPTTNVQYVS